MASIDTNQPAPKLLPSQGGDPAEFIPTAYLTETQRQAAEQLSTRQLAQERDRKVTSRALYTPDHEMWHRINAWIVVVERELAERKAGAHEQAHRENERRWAHEVTEAIDVDSAPAVAELAIRIRRNWRLSRELHPATRFTRIASMAVRELHDEYDLEVTNEQGVWSLTLV